MHAEYSMSQDRNVSGGFSPRLLAWFSCAHGVITGETHLSSLCEGVWLSRIGEYRFEKHKDMERFSKKASNDMKEDGNDVIMPQH